MSVCVGACVRTFACVRMHVCACVQGGQTKLSLILVVLCILHVVLRDFHARFNRRGLCGLMLVVVHRLAGAGECALDAASRCRRGYARKAMIQTGSHCVYD